MPTFSNKLITFCSFNSSPINILGITFLKMIDIISVFEINLIKLKYIFPFEYFLEFLYSLKVESTLSKLDFNKSKPILLLNNASLLL